MTQFEEIPFMQSGVTVKQDMLTAIKVGKYNISKMYKGIIIFVFMVLTCNWIYKNNFQAINLGKKDLLTKISENKLFMKISCVTVLS